MGYEQELLKKLIQSSSDCIAAFDHQYRYTLWNLAMENISGLSQAAVMDQNAFDLFPILQKTGESQYYHLALQGQTTLIENRLYRLPKTGQKRYFNVQYSPIHDDVGGVVGGLVIARDVTEHRQIEALLQKSKDQNQALVNAIPDLIIRMDQDGTYLDFKPAKDFKTIALDDDMVGKRIDEVMPEALAKQRMFYVKQALLTGTTQIYEYSLMIHGKVHEEEARIVASGEHEVIAIIRDITDRKRHESDRNRAEAELRQAKAELEARVRERTAELEHINQRLQNEITEHNHARIALQNYADTITDLYNNAPCGYHSLDQNGVFLQINDIELNWLGYPRAAIIGKKRLTDFLTPASQQFFHKNFAQLKRKGWVKDLEYELVRADGTLLPVLLNSTAIRDAESNFVMTRTSMFDITQRKQVEANLQQSEQRYRAIVEDQTELIARFQLDGTLTFVNGAYSRYFGNEVDGLKNYYRPIVWVEECQQIEQQLQTLHADRPVALIENRVMVDGQIRWMQWTHRALFDDQGHFIEFQAVGRDISDHKKSEEEIQFLQAMTQAIFESEDFQSALGIALQKVGEATGWNFGEAWIPRADDSVLECSSAWYGSTPGLEKFRAVSEQLTFDRGSGLPGRVWQSQRPEWMKDVSAESPQVYVRAEFAKAVGLKAGLGIPLIANGVVLAILVFYMFEARDEDERLIELISASTQLGLIIQRKRAEEEVRQALDKERELNELKSRFIAMTSHEFRTPLSIIAFSSGLLSQYGNRWTEEKRSTHFHRIQTALQRMTQLLDDVLFLGKEASGKLELKPMLIPLKKFCSELVEEMQLSAGSRYRLTLQMQEACSEAYLDEKLLRQILNNLLSNAIKYSPTGGEIYLQLLCQANEAVFQIRDRGIGIPLEDQPHLFESFHRASNAGVIPGSGLGLSIVKRSVDLHGGHITLASKVGVGTTFTVTLPLRQPNSKLT
ncbi:MAG: PAS domain S-box protein [Scytolyngbya sp. HA4215-MV1]|nr:PAS domain S-box protein [Scytolyngbya sp. HA4215-MV1]